MPRHVLQLIRCNDDLDGLTLTMSHLGADNNPACAVYGDSLNVKLVKSSKSEKLDIGARDVER